MSLAAFAVTLILCCFSEPRFTYRALQGSLFPSPVRRAQHLDRLTAEERMDALKKWRGAGTAGRAPWKYAEHPAAKSERRGPSGPPTALTVASAPTRAVEQGSSSVRETALDSDFSETKASGRARPSEG